MTRRLRIAAIPYRLRIENTAASSMQVTQSVRVWGPAGERGYLFGPSALTLAAGQVISTDFSVTTPATLAAGDYWLIGRVENPTAVYDESKVVYSLR